MKIIVDRARCAGLGICESFAAEVFEVKGDGRREVARCCRQAAGSDVIREDKPRPDW